MGRSPDVTIFADAAMCLKTGASGWGAWMVSARVRPQIFGGPMNQVYGYSDDVELAALTNALHMAKRRGYITQGALVMLQSDSTRALGFVRWKFRAADRPMPKKRDGVKTLPIDPNRCTRPDSVAHRLKALDVLAALVEEMNLTLVVRHVRGHREGDASRGDGRAWVNQECDRVAKIGKEAARKALAATPALETVG